MPYNKHVNYNGGALRDQYAFNVSFEVNHSVDDMVYQYVAILDSLLYSTDLSKQKDGL